MSKEFVFYTHPMSRGRTVRWALEEIGQPYQTVLLEYHTSMKSPEYLAINPLGKVPAIRHGKTIVTESAAICAYLADAFPETGLAPKLNDPKRGEYYRWLFFVAGPLEACLVNKALGVDVAPEKKIMVGYGELDTMLNLLEETLSNNRHLLGEQFSVADIMLGSLLAWMMFKVNLIAPRQVFARYLELITSRPAAVRASQMDDALCG